MRIFFLTLEWTALERFIRREAAFVEGMPSVYLPWLHYKKRGYDVDIFIVGDFEKADIVDFQGCSIHLVPRPKFFRNRQCGFFLSKLCRLVDDIVVCLVVGRFVRGQSPPDIIYSYRVDFVCSGWLLAKFYHALFIKRFFGTWSYLNWYHRGLKAGCLLEFLRWLWPSDMLIVTNDGTNGDKIAELLRIRKSKFRVWLNGVDKEWLCNNERSEALKTDLGLTSDDFILMCLSRLDDWKRQDRVICAMPLILKEVPHAKLVIVGSGPARQKLEAMVQELNLEGNVLFTGIIEHNKVRNMLGVADVFLQTNDLSCLGNTLLEAMICGRTIVTWDVGTTREVIIDGQTGCLMPNAEPETIGRTVIDLAKNPEKRKRLAEGARRFAEEHLQSWDERLDMEIDLIEGIRAGKSQWDRSFGVF